MSVPKSFPEFFVADKSSLIDSVWSSCKVQSCHCLLFLRRQNTHITFLFTKVSFPCLKPDSPYNSEENGSSSNWKKISKEPDKTVVTLMYCPKFVFHRKTGNKPYWKDPHPSRYTKHQISSTDHWDIYRFWWCWIHL